MTAGTLCFEDNTSGTWKAGSDMFMLTLHDQQRDAGKLTQPIILQTCQRSIVDQKIFSRNRIFSCFTFSLTSAPTHPSPESHLIIIMSECEAQACRYNERQRMELTLLHKGHVKKAVWIFSSRGPTHERY